MKKIKLIDLIVGLIWKFLCSYIFTGNTTFIFWKMLIFYQLNKNNLKKHIDRSTCKNKIKLIFIIINSMELKSVKIFQFGTHHSTYQ